MSNKRIKGVAYESGGYIRRTKRTGGNPNPKPPTKRGKTSNE